MGSKGERHLSRIAMPKSWDFARKTTKWITRPLPGAHPMHFGLPLNLILRDVLGFAKTAKEVKNILNNQEVLVDGKRRKEPRLIIGLMDVLSIPKLHKSYRIMINAHGNLVVHEISDEESKTKLCKIKGKSQVHGKISLNLHDGRNILLDKENANHKIGDSLLIELPSQKIRDAVKFEKGSLIFLIAGKHKGDVGSIEEIKDDRVIYKKGNETFETAKEYAFAIGKNKPLIKLEK
jgi:small subunit ribosomal protein S4e